MLLFEINNLKKTVNEMINNFSEINNDYNPIKNAKKQTPFIELPDDILKEIFTYLPVKDLWNIQISSKQFHSLTSFAWKNLNLKNRGQLTWSDCKDFEHKEMFNFILSTAFCRIWPSILGMAIRGDSDPIFKASVLSIDKTNTQFAPILKNCKIFEQLLFMKKYDYKRDSEIIENIDINFIGDRMIKLLIEAKNTNGGELSLKKINQLVINELDQGNAYGVRMITNDSFCWSWYIGSPYDLVIEAAKLGDYGPLKRYIDRLMLNESLSKKKEILDFPPIQLIQAKRIGLELDNKTKAVEDNIELLKKQNDLVYSALLGYGCKVPHGLYLLLSLLKFKLWQATPDKGYKRTLLREIDKLSRFALCQAHRNHVNPEETIRAIRGVVNAELIKLEQDERIIMECWKRAHDEFLWLFKDSVSNSFDRLFDLMQLFLNGPTYCFNENEKQNFLNLSEERLKSFSELYKKENVELPEKIQDFKNALEKLKKL